MVARKCRDCGKYGNEEPDDPAPRLCHHCYQARLERISPILEGIFETFGHTIALMWLEDALVDIGGETPEAAKRHVDGLARGESISYAEWLGRK